jgi:hypothetical protein
VGPQLLPVSASEPAVLVMLIFLRVRATSCTASAVPEFGMSTISWMPSVSYQRRETAAAMSGLF